jgi:predicted small lipoprotein YifL
MLKKISVILVLIVLAGCIGGGVYVPPEAQYSNVKKIIINGLNDELEICIYYDKVGGDFKNDKQKIYTKDTQELFSDGIDILYIVPKLNIDPPQHIIQDVFEDNTLTITVVKE